MPVRPTDIDRIQHMQNAVKKIFSYTEEIGFEEFMNSDLVQDAVVKNFEVIGEAAYKITSEFKKQFEHIEWSKIQGLRHILVHDYYMINPEILWNTKEEHLHRLLVDLDEIIESGGG